MVSEQLLSAQLEGQKLLKREGEQLRVFWKGLYVKQKDVFSSLTKFKAWQWPSYLTGIIKIVLWSLNISPESIYMFIQHIYSKQQVQISPAPTILQLSMHRYLETGIRKVLWMLNSTRKHTFSPLNLKIMFRKLI